MSSVSSVFQDPMFHNLSMLTVPTPITQVGLQKLGLLFHGSDYARGLCCEPIGCPQGHLMPSDVPQWPFVI